MLNPSPFDLIFRTPPVHCALYFTKAKANYPLVNFALAKVLFSAFCGRCQRKKNLKSKVLDTVDGLTKFNQVRIATDTFCAYYKPIKARYFPALHFDWLIFKYGTEVATTIKSLQIFNFLVTMIK